MKRRLLILMGLALPLIIYLPFINQFALPAKAEYSDLLITHYPNALFIWKSLTQWHVIPLWSNTILCGYPFAANPLSGLWYPPGWLALISLPKIIGFNTGVLLHLFASGLGFYLLMKQRGNSTTAALFGAMVFEAMPKLIAHWGAGHVTLIYALSWTPWLLWAENRRLCCDQKPIFKFLPGIILGMITLADVRWLPLAGFVWAGYGINRVLKSDHGLYQPRQWLSQAFHMGLQPIIAIFIAAPLLIPMLEYIPLTTRRSLSPVEGLAISLPPSKLLGLLLPDLGGYAEWVVYPGAFVLFMLILNLAVPALRKNNWGWLALAAASLIFALGELIPGMEWFVSLPGLNLLRAPSRAMFLFGMAVAAMTTTGVDWLTHEPKWKFDPAFFMTPFPVFAILLAAGLWFINHEVAVNFIWGASALTGALIGVFAIERRWLPNQIWFGMAMALILGDLMGVNLYALQHRSLSSVLFSGAPLTQFLQTAISQSPGRIYSPSYSIQQQTAAYFGFELVDGIDPMQLSTYSDYMKLATGVPSMEYGVTIPAFDGDPETANRSYVPDGERLGLLNVNYIAAAFPIKSDDLELLEQTDSTYVYRNLRFRPRAWIQTSISQWGDDGVEHIELAPNLISIQAEGPGLLVLSELYYPGWVASIDSSPVEIQAVSGVLRGIHLPAGPHLVEFRYRPLSVYSGLLLSILVWLILAVVLITRPA